MSEKLEPWFDATKWPPLVSRESPANAPWPVPIIEPNAVPQAPTGAPWQANGYAPDDEGRPLDLPPPTPPMPIPGLVGELVNYAWNSASWQIAEVAIASALSTMSVLCSRTYRHGTLGLSLYLITLAQTSTGKSFGFSANDRWLNKLVETLKEERLPVQEKIVAAKAMIISELGSAQGLAQHMPDSPSTLFHADEFVETIKLMSQQNPPAHIAQLRAELLRLMEMSGLGRIYRSRKYSKRSDRETVPDVLMASLTILATGTPDAFYDDLSPSLLTGGFIPRFVVMEYAGNIAEKNRAPVIEPSDALVNKISYLFNQSYTRGKDLTGDINEVIDVQAADMAAQERIDWFENVCIRKAYEANERGLPTAGLWSRAKEQIKKIASLIAIGCSPTAPRIAVEHVNIAIEIVRPGVEKICAKFERGEVGTGDDRLASEIKKFMTKLYIGGSAKFAKYPGIKPELLDAGIIQMAAVKNYCMKLSVFRNHKDAQRAFDNAVNALIRYKEIEQVTVEGKKDFLITLNVEAFKPLLEKAKTGKL